MEEQDCPPARKVVSRSPAKTVRLLNLRGIWDSPVECESTLERDFVYRIALCPGVVRLKHQPFRMQLAAGKIYTPDFLASHRDGSVSVIEVKPKEKVAAYLHVFDEASTRLAARGLTFTVLTEERIRANKMHERASLILRYRKTCPDLEVLERIRTVLRERGNAVAIDALLLRAEAPIEALFHLIAMRAVVPSRDLLITGKGRVRLFNESEVHHAFRTEGWFGVSSWRAAARGHSDPGGRPSSVSGRADLPGSDGQAG
jgi:hypothetical protein